MQATFQSQQGGVRGRLAQGLLVVAALSAAARASTNTARASTTTTTTTPVAAGPENLQRLLKPVLLSSDARRCRVHHLT